MVHYTYLKALIGDNGDFVVKASYSAANKITQSQVCVWMVPGTWTDKYDDYKVERFNNCVTLSKKSA
jgi:hypothetical protein